MVTLIRRFILSLFIVGISSEELKSEIDIMKCIGHHPNIIALFGCNTIFEPNFIVMELAQFGDLDKYLQAKLQKVCCSILLVIDH